MPSPQINSILDKLKQVNERRAKNGKSLYRFNPPLSETAIQDFEIRHAIRLPEDYRSFLLHVGDGNFETYSYKINPLAESDRFNPLDKEPLRLNQPFPFTGSMGHEIINETVYDFYPASKVREILNDVDDVDVTGFLLLNYEGWGSSHIALVITGEQRGIVWHVDDLYHPFYKLSGNRFITSFSFLDWLEHTLDKELQPSGQELIRSGRHDEVFYLSLAGESQEWQKDFELKDIFKCSNLESLDLSRNYTITDLSDDIGKLRKLIQLKFNGGGLQRLPDVLCTLQNLEILELAYQHLYELPENIGELIQLKRLSLYWNRELKTLPSSFSKLQNLVHLSIGCCDTLDLTQALPLIGMLSNLKKLSLTTQSIPYEIGSLKQIEVLTIEKPYGEQQTLLSEELGALNNLKVLNLSGCGIVESPNWITALNNLEYLSLSANPLDSLPRDIGQLTKLRNLDISDTPLVHLPESLSTLKDLSEISVDRCHNLDLKNAFLVLGKLPNIKWLFMDTNKKMTDEIGELIHLNKLSFFCQSEEQHVVPASIGKLKKLNWINIRTRGELVFPQSLTALEELEVLLVESKSIVLPPTIGQLKNLVKLDLRCDEGLTHLPENFEQLHNLRTLYLDGSHKLDWEVFFRTLARMPKLRHLTVATKKLPQEIGLCTQLESLHVYNYAEDNPLYNDPLIIPLEIGHLKNLKELTLDENQLQELPDSIGELTNLVHLNISDNQLSVFPAQLLKLTSLRQLYIGNNLFKEVPDEVRQMPKLKDIDF